MALRRVINNILILLFTSNHSQAFVMKSSAALDDASTDADFLEPPAVLIGLEARV
ncbi:hypothetical protein N9D08_01685 [bacterium]|nr:hypothetical protein [bacterium]